MQERSIWFDWGLVGLVTCQLREKERMNEFESNRTIKCVTLVEQNEHVGCLQREDAYIPRSSVFPSSQRSASSSSAVSPAGSFGKVEDEA